MLYLSCRKNRRLDVTITDVFYHGTKYPIDSFTIRAVIGECEAIVTGANTFMLIPNTEQVEDQCLLLEVVITDDNGSTDTVNEMVIMHPREGDESVIYCRISGPKRLDAE